MSVGCEGRRTKIWRIAAVFAATGALALSGCASSTESGGPATSTTAATGQAHRARRNIKSSGKLVVGVNIPYTPNEFKDPSGKIVGFDVDLMNAIASTLGLTPDYRESDFAKIIPSIQGGTYNVGMSSFTDTKEREKSVDLVTYASAGILWAQRPDNPVDPNNACGKKVSVQATTTEETCVSRTRDTVRRATRRCQGLRGGPGWKRYEATSRATDSTSAISPTRQPPG